jgi:hypothetical protein
MERRKRAGHKYSGGSVFFSKLICGECGGFYGSKVWHSNTKYRKVIWQCNAKIKDKTGCQTPHLTDGEIREKFIEAMNRLLKDRDSVLANLDILRQTAEDTAGLQTDFDVLAAQMELLAKEQDDLIHKNARQALDQEQYTKEFYELDRQFKAKQDEYERLSGEMDKAKSAVDIITDFKGKLAGLKQTVTEFDIDLWGEMVESVTVQKDGKLVFRFKAEIEITV